MFSKQRDEWGRHCWRRTATSQWPFIRFIWMLAKTQPNVKISWFDLKITENCNCFRDWPFFIIKSLNAPTSWKPYQGKLQYPKEKTKVVETIDNEEKLCDKTMLSSSQKGHTSLKSIASHKHWDFVNQIKISPGNFWLAFILYCSQHSNSMSKSVGRNQSFLFNCGLPFSKSWHILRTPLH